MQKFEGEGEPGTEPCPPMAFLKMKSPVYHTLYVKYETLPWHLYRTEYAT